MDGQFYSNKIEKYGIHSHTNKYMKKRDGYLTLNCILVSLVIFITIISISNMLDQNLRQLKKFEEMYRNDYKAEIALLDLQLNLYYSLEDEYSKSKDMNKLLNSYKRADTSTIYKVKNRSYVKYCDSIMSINNEGSGEHIEFTMDKDKNFILMRFYVFYQNGGKNDFTRSMKKNILFYDPSKLSYLKKEKEGYEKEKEGYEKEKEGYEKEKEGYEKEKEGYEKEKEDYEKEKEDYEKEKEDLKIKNREELNPEDIKKIISEPDTDTLGRMYGVYRK